MIQGKRRKFRRNRSECRPSGYTIESLEWRGLLSGLTFTEFPQIGMGTNFVQNLTAGPDGNVYFSSLLANDIGSISPTGLVKVDNTTSVAANGLSGVAVGADGNIYFDASNSFGELALPGGTVSSIPLSNALNTSGLLTRGPDGNFWADSSNVISRITPGGQVTNFSYSGGAGTGQIVSYDGGIDFASGTDIRTVSTSGVFGAVYALPGGGTVEGITVGPDGNLWFTEQINGGATNDFGYVTPTGAVKEFASSMGRVAGIAAGSDGNIYFRAADYVVGVNVAGTVIATQDLGGGSNIDGTELIAGPDGNLWYNERLADCIGVIDLPGATPTPVSTPTPTPTVAPGLSVTEFPQIGMGTSFLQNLTAGPDGNVYFSSGLNNNVGSISPTGAVTIYNTTPVGPNAPDGVAVGSDGNIYFNTGSNFGQIALPAGTVSEVPLNIGMPADGVMTLGPDGNFWVASFFSAIDRVTPAGHVTGFGYSGSGSSQILSYNGGLYFPSGTSIHSISTSGVLGPTYTLPSGGTVEGIAAGPDGNLWFTEQVTVGSNTNSYYGYLTPSGTMTEFPSAVGPVWGIAAGSDGNIYYRAADFVVGVNLAGTVIAVQDLGAGNNTDGEQLIAGPDGNLWYNERFGDRIGVVRLSGAIPTPISTPTPTPTTFAPGLSFTAFPPIGMGTSFVQNLTAGADGNVYFSSGLANNVDSIGPTGTVTVYNTTPVGGNAPGGVVLGSDGNIYFDASNNFGEIALPAGMVSSIPLSPSINLSGLLTRGPDGNFWTDSANLVQRISPSGQVTNFSFKGAGSGPMVSFNGGLYFESNASIRSISTSGVFGPVYSLPSGGTVEGITAGPDGNLWFTEQIASGGSINDYFGYLTPSGTINEIPSAFGAVWGIAAGRDGNIYYRAGDYLVGVNLAGTVIAMQNLGSGNNTDGKELIAGPDGNLWYNENLADRIGVVYLETPAIATLTASPASIVSGGSVTLTAGNVGEASGTVTSVAFYRESNGTSGLQVGSDTPVGSGTQSGTNWVLPTSTAGLAAGTYTYYAVATDSNAVTCPSVSTTITVTSAASIGSLSVSPTSVASGTSVSVSANSVTDAGSTVARVTFYRESNGIAGLQSGSDTYLGSGTQSGTTWTISTSTSGLAAGTYTYYAVANDSTGNNSPVASTTLSVTSVCVIGSVSVSPTSVVSGGTVSLLANSVTDSGSTVTAVSFYRESNGTAGLQTSTDTLVGAGTQSGATWTLANVSTSGLIAGAYTYYAVANDATGTSSAPASATLTVTGQPTIGSFALSPTSVASGASTTLTASNVAEAGGTISTVKFYRESNGTAGLQTGADTLLGAGTQNGAAWTLGNVSTSGLIVGTYTYYAVANDATGASSLPVSTTLSVTAAPPTIGAFSASPSSVGFGGSTTLTTSNVTESGGTITAVNFYRESNGTSGLQVGSDAFVGTGTQNGTTWTITASTAALSSGTYTYYAVATDSTGIGSSVASSGLTVRPPPTVGTFTLSPTSVAVGGSTTLTAANVTESGGTISSVSFYRESNDTSGLQIGSDTLAGTGARNGTTWTLSTSTAGLAAGTYTYYALATDSTGVSSAAAAASLTITGPPTIGVFSLSPTTVLSGASTTLTAATVTESGGTISNVKFYRESNSTSGLQIGSDTLLGTGAQSGTTWTLSTSTSGFSAGAYTYYAIATDTTGTSSAAAQAILTVTAPPTIGTFSLSPTTIVSGGPATLTAGNVAETGGIITTVNFYRESNGTSGLQTASDTLLGEGTQSGATWTLSASTAGFAAGVYTYYAVAIDGTGISSSVASATLTVTSSPSIGSLSVSPSPVVAGSAVSLSANSVSDTGSAITSVSFYRESNGTSGLQIGSDTLLGTGTQSGTTWALSTSTARLGAGTFTYYAVATDASGVTSPAASATVTLIPASPLAKIAILASASPSGPFTSNLAVTPGETIYYEVTGQLSAIGTSNAAGIKSYTISSETAHPGIATIGYDGIQNLSFGLSDSGSFVGTFGSDALSANPSTGDNWAALNGASPGVASGAAVTGVLAGLPSGVFGGATSPEPILTGSFIVPSGAFYGVASTIAAAISPSGTGSLAINSNPSTGSGSSKIAVTGGDPFGYFGFTPLILTTALPAWLSANSAATWNSSTNTLTITGPATIIADPGSAEPNIVASGSAAELTIAPTASDVDIHVGGVTLTSGARITVASVGSGRSHDNHNTLVIGTPGAASDPIFSIDSSSTLDLQDNDLVVHTGTSDTNGSGELAAVQALARTGRDGGAWDGNQLTSTSAQTQNNNDGLESVQLAVVDNADLASPLASWQVGNTSESLGGNDIIVKYTYTGDFNLDGQVNFNDSCIFGLYYDNGATANNEWAFGDTNGDGKLTFADSSNFGLDFGNGTGNVGAQDPMQL